MHHAFVVERAWLDEVEGALNAFAQGDDAWLQPVLGRWWTTREARLADARVRLTDADRIELANIDPALRDVPDSVRPDALAQVRRIGPRLAALDRIAAPSNVRARQRELLQTAIGGLDPARPFSPSPSPAIVCDEHDRPAVDLWLDALVRAAAAAREDLGVGAIGELPSQLPRAVWPGATTFAHAPDDGTLDAQTLRLPRELAVHGRCVVAESSGPITAALAGDTPSTSIEPRLAALVRGLGPGQALLSFVWRATETAGAFSAL